MLILAVDPGVRGGYCLGLVDALQIVDAGELPRVHIPFRGWRREQTVPDLGAILARMRAMIQEVSQAWTDPVPRPVIAFEAAWARPRQSVVALWSQACEYASLIGQTIEAIRHWPMAPALMTVAPLKWIPWYNARAGEGGKAGIATAIARRFPDLEVEQVARGPRGGLLTGVSDAVGLYGYVFSNYKALLEIHHATQKAAAKPGRPAQSL